MGDSVLYQAWYDRASTDLAGANILYEHGGAYELVAFHCQQAIEKQLKGWILKESGELMEGHNLPFLRRHAISLGAPLQSYGNDMGFVNQFYIETRYPADEYIAVSEEEAQDCLDVAKAILAVLK